MSTDEYVPEEVNVRMAYVLAGVPDNASPDSIKRAERRAGPEFDRFLARVRRDAADQAEAELDSWMTRAYEAEKRAWQAEARIKAVEDELLAVEGDYGPYGALRLGVVRRIRRALIQ